MTPPTGLHCQAELARCGWPCLKLPEPGPGVPAPISPGLRAHASWGALAETWLLVSTPALGSVSQRPSNLGARPDHTELQKHSRAVRRRRTKRYEVIHGRGLRLQSRLLLTDTEGRVGPGARRHKLAGGRQVSAGDVRCSVVVALVNMLYRAFESSDRIGLESPHHKKRNSAPLW